MNLPRFSQDPQVTTCADAASESLDDAERVEDAIRHLFPVDPKEPYTQHARLAEFSARLFTGDKTTEARLVEAMADRWNAYNREQQD
jgi:hypothetical protein